MTAKNNTPAFPCEWDYIGSNREAANGMTLRDYFAAKAMQGFLSQSHVGPARAEHMGHGWGEDCANDLNAHRMAFAQSLADFSYKVADAMLNARAAQ
jgi:hypothetical protein